MPPPFRPLGEDCFVRELKSTQWRRRILRVDMHHTYYPAHGDYKGLSSIEAMWRYHTLERQFEDIAQHVSIAPDGTLWSGRDFNKVPASVGGVLNRDAFMFEIIGNFDFGADRLEGRQLAATIFVIRAVQHLFGLPAEALLFHREVPVTDKTCPGTSVSKRVILDLVRAAPRPALRPLRWQPAAEIAAA